MILNKSDKITELKILLKQYIETDDTVILNKFLNAIRKPLLKKIRFYVNDYEDAEDILQESLLRIKEKTHLYDENISSPITWIFSKIAYGLILHYFRDQKLTSNQQFDDFDGSDGSYAKIPLISREIKMNLNKTIFKLKKYEYQDVIILHHYASIELKEIANLLNINHATIRTWHDRAKELLYSMLKK
jgi:RNA polymerase sigma factor (sigma-70 family)